MYTKTRNIDINWLARIDGSTVADAIEYLKTLDQNKKLVYFMEGDTQGCEVNSYVQYEVEMTSKEILESLEKKYLKEIAVYEKAREVHLKNNMASRVESCETILQHLRSKLEGARAKYSKD